jgi:hypothetical protein
MRGDPGEVVDAYRRFLDVGKNEAADEDV